MAQTPKIVRKGSELRSISRGWRTKGLTSAVVPTMGALHRGHITLVEEALRRADRVIATIFVNPKQFGRREDLSRYPRDEELDGAILAKAGVEVVFAPGVDEMYPADFATTVSLNGPARAGLEDKFRPQFFSGVTTAVAKLLIFAESDFAMFGEKDYQQLKVVQHLVRDLGIPTEIVPVPTVRDADGLAMSSRNAYLTPAQRSKASHLSQALTEAAQAIGEGMGPSRAAAAARRSLLKLGFRVDYLTARNADSLTLLKSKGEPVRILAAAWLGKTRLIDNMPV